MEMVQRMDARPINRSNWIIFQSRNYEHEPPHFSLDNWNEFDKWVTKYFEKYFEKNNSRWFIMYHLDKGEICVLDQLSPASLGKRQYQGAVFSIEYFEQYTPEIMDYLFRIMSVATINGCSFREAYDSDHEES